MLCSGSASYVAHYAGDDRGFPCVGNIIIDDDIGLTPVQQKDSMKVMLMAGCGGVTNGVVDDTYFKYKASLITPDATEIADQNPVVDINFTVQYIGNFNTSYPELISMTLNEIIPGSQGAGIYTAIGNAVSGIINSTDSFTALSNFKMKAFDIHVRKAA